MDIKKNAVIICTGCPESHIDSAQVENFVKENGWNVINDFKKADLIIFRACALTEHQVNKALYIIKEIKVKKNVNSNLIVWGCLPKIDPLSLKKEYEGITFGEREYEILDELINAKKKIKNVNANFLTSYLYKYCNFKLLDKIYFYLSQIYSIANPLIKVYYIKVSTGCLNKCTFCAVRISRGFARSKKIDDIITEFKDGLRKGYKYFGLLATDLGSYGKDQGYDLIGLLNMIIKEKGYYKIGLRNLHPKYFIEMFDDLLPIFKSGKIWFLLSPVESGSNRILKLMNRNYDIEDYKECIKQLKKECPEILIRTQIMIGFPSETEIDFQQTLQLIDEVKFDWTEVYTFSKRPGTMAAIMENQIPERIKNIRYKKIKKETLLHTCTQKNKINMSFYARAVSFLLKKLLLTVEYVRSQRQLIRTQESARKISHL